MDKKQKTIRQAIKNKQAQQNQINAYNKLFTEFKQKNPEKNKKDIFEKKLKK